MVRLIGARTRLAWPAVAAGDDLMIALARIADQDPAALTRWPDAGETDGACPPFEVGLAAWATWQAERLHAAFGADIRLTVGALRYPDPTAAPPARRLGRPRPHALDPGVATVALDEPLVVPSGRSARPALLVTNAGSDDLVLETGHDLAADVIDPASGTVVGGYSGPELAVRRTDRIRPGATLRLPLLVGTDSYLPDLGYAIPPGRWGIQAPLALGQPGGPVCTPVLPLTVA
jgi:hypothetical protein